ncbi:DEKNAAC104958 [Brettanomyces naardenensis]|uniref:DEKNAAC104958 n=1 Tax=Brettanomyces naardenensis TaxID=13370 RepID=A0A448YSJ2_BRENA|nr:DEKNAAC104958 [Brettanomyces naardenensis]
MSGSSLTSEQPSQGSSHQQVQALADSGYLGSPQHDELAALGTERDIDPVLDRPPTQNEINSLLASLPSADQPTTDKQNATNQDQDHLKSTRLSGDTTVEEVHENPSNGNALPDAGSSSPQLLGSEQRHHSQASTTDHPVTTPIASFNSSTALSLQQSRSIHGVSIKHEPRGIDSQDLESVSVPAPPEKIQAYALLDFDNFTFYVQTMQIMLGRMVEGDKTTEALDIHLGPQKAISRRHAKIFYNFGNQRFELSVLGRNGAFVDDSFVENGVTLPLRNNARIQIGETRFRFILPADEGGSKIGEAANLDSHSSPINPAQAVDLKTAFGNGHSHNHSSISTQPLSRDVSRSPISARTSIDVSSASSPKPLLSASASSRNARRPSRGKSSAEESKSPSPLISQADLLRTTSAHAAQAQAIAQNEAFAIQKGYLPASYLNGSQSSATSPTQTSLAQQQYVSSLQQTPYNPQTQSVPKLGKEFIDELRANAEASVIRKEEARAAAAAGVPPAASSTAPSNVPEGAPVSSNLGDNSKKERKRSRSKRAYTLEEIPEAYRTKPSCSYSTMITRCLQKNGTERGMSLSEIYRGIQEMYPYYEYCSDGWQSSVRHNLSMNKSFRKVSKEGKGWLWGLNKEAVSERERRQQKQTSPGESEQQKQPRASSPSSSKLSGDTKKALSYLQRELVRLTKDRKMYDRATTTQILTQALAMTIAQVNQAAKNAGIKGSPLLTLIDKNPGHVTKILSAALNAAAIQIAKKKGLPVHLPSKGQEGQESEIQEEKEKDAGAVDYQDVPTSVSPPSPSESKIKPISPSLNTAPNPAAAHQSSGIRKPQYYGRSSPATYHSISKPAPFAHQPSLTGEPTSTQMASELPERFQQFTQPSSTTKLETGERTEGDDEDEEEDFNQMLENLENQHNSEQKRLKEERQSQRTAEGEEGSTQSKRLTESSPQQERKVPRIK